MKTTDSKEDNRKKYPRLAMWVDEVRKHFPNSKVVAIRPRSQASHEQDVLDDVIYPQ